MKKGVEDSYLLILFYRKKDMVEYHNHELLLVGNKNNIDNIVKSEIKQFNEVNKDLGYKVELYNLFKFVEAEDFWEW